jgi:predicted S18 family serine protease
VSRTGITKVKQIVALLILTLAAIAPAQAACLSQSQARQVVASGQAASLGSVAGRVQGEILKAQLCQQGGGYVYILSVKNGSKVTTVTVNASR